MKTLFILRHAKAARDDVSVTDHQRALTKRGREAATAMAQHMGRCGIAPDLVLCSDALRTRQTLERIEGGIGRPGRVEIRADLYLADGHYLLELLRSVEKSINAIMLIGHNPGLEDLALLLTDAAGRRTEASALKRLREKFPTCALATLEFQIPLWTELKSGRGALRTLALPSDLIDGARD